MTDQPEKLDLRSHDIAEDKQQELLRLFPEIRTEGGKLDFERLKLALGESVDVGKERYGMNWPGKADCFKTIQQPSLATLRPCPEESVNFDASENLIIEGDNLEVLKLLQKSYLGKVKMIYIDPPYNTGNDFIYPDNYSESLQTYLEYTGQVDAEGRKFGTNAETEGRFHSKWLNMMYPRLYLARNLLREDGVIFVTIDDNEVDNLRKLCAEIFGEENFVAQVVWEKIYTTKNDSSLLSSCHDYVLCYTRSVTEFDVGLLPRSKEMDARYANSDNDSRGPWKPIPLYADGERKNGRYTITGPTGRRFEPPQESHWRYVEADVAKLIADGRIHFGKDGGSQPNLKRFLSEVRAGAKAKTIWFHKEVGSNDTANREMKNLFGEGGSPFEFPKPSGLVSRMLRIAPVEQDDIVLDFFAGSGTTGHAVLDLNKQDGGHRKFLLAQLPEPTGREDYPTIADITKERVRRVIKKLNDEDAGKLDLDGDQKQDRGFRVFKLAESNFKPWNADVAHEAHALERQLELHVDHIRDGRGPGAGRSARSGGLHAR
jgi:adenine-specific DNA-methyltransferase